MCILLVNVCLCVCLRHGALYGIFQRGTDKCDSIQAGPRPSFRSLKQRAAFCEPPKIDQMLSHEGSHEKSPGDSDVRDKATTVPVHDDGAFVGLVIHNASLPLSNDDEDTLDVFEGTCTVDASDVPGRYYLVFNHAGVEHRVLARAEIVRLVMENASKFEPAPLPPSRCAATCFGAEQIVWGSRPEAVAQFDACVEEGMDDDMADVTEVADIDSGQALCVHGSVHMGKVSLLCHGTLAGQLWSAGAALGLHLQQV